LPAAKISSDVGQAILPAAAFSGGFRGPSRYREPAESRLQPGLD
jgi:hypothetical protein